MIIRESERNRRKVEYELRPEVLYDKKSSAIPRVIMSSGIACAL